MKRKYLLFKMCIRDSFNPYGAYQISKCIIEGIKKAGLPISNYLRSDYSGYNPAHPVSYTHLRSYDHRIRGELLAFIDKIYGRAKRFQRAIIFLNMP